MRTLVVVTVSMKTEYNLGIPAVLLTVLGVVIGFVISYRAMSGYERYWMGRTCWTDVVRTSRAMGRLVWYHVPVRTKAHGPDMSAEDKQRDSKKAMKEKYNAMNLIEA